ncbi:MAG: cupin domain-containing protein [Alphaproteobacteria bacterium]|nr:cupin domain-containing protein [Alphaproteobacteria bacterium]
MTGRTKLFRAARDGFRWEDVATLAYKQEGSAAFRDISRQVLFEHPDLGCQLRYFEMQPGGYSTLERHEHVHAVMILRGHGECLLGQDVRRVKPHDLVTIPAMTWHQFRADDGEAMGFLCMVNAVRDKPLLPTGEDLAALGRDPRVRAFLARTGGR